MTSETENAIEAVKQGNLDYYTNALEFAKNWIKITFKPFSSEDLKEAFYANGNTPPDEPRVFGAVIKALHKNKLIKFHSYQRYKSASGHGRPSSVWISTDYRLKQQNNRNAPYKDQLLLTFET